MSLFMIITVLPTGAVISLAESNEAVITVESITATPGSKVDVKVSINNNPGILGAIISLSYSEGLVLTNVAEGEAFSALSMTKPGKYQSPCQFTWDGVDLDDSDIKNGVILTLSFDVSENASEGDKYSVNITSRNGDFVDTQLNPVDISISSGIVSIINYDPGDVNGDKNINMMDVILIRRYIAGGYDVTINAGAADVNADSSINMIDVIMIRRYIAGGYGVVLVSSLTTHKHILEKTDYVDATCSEKGNIAYWHCTACDKYYSDVNCVNEISLNDTIIEELGHTVVAFPYVAATYEDTGFEGGTYCSVCNEVLSERRVIPKLEQNQYSITYYVNNDYLENKDIENQNPRSYTSEQGIASLLNIQADGYVFEGWYDGPGSSANKVLSIPIGSTGNKELYAHWTTREYTIQFDSPLAPIDSKVYTVSQGATLSNPEWFGYTFVGWSDDNGNIVKSIKPGTTGDITLHANWTSLRNQTVPVEALSDPIIYEDSENGQYLFSYELGRIENVPLFTIKDFGNRSGITVTETTSTSGSISETSANTIANMISNATTRSDSWSLSEEWNDSTTISEEHASEVSSQVMNSATSSHDETGKWSISSGNGGTKSATTENGTSAKVSAKVGAGASAGPYSVNAEVGAEAGVTSNDSRTNTRNWNTNLGYEGSRNSSSSSSSSSSFANSISNKSGYAQTKAHNKGTSETKTYAVSNTESREYTSSLSYAKATTETTTKTYSNADAPQGYYRLVAAGTIHVFGVVGYDIATKSYYTFTYSIIDDEIKSFIDYSKTTSNYDDYENGVLPFDVPYAVNEYINDVLYTSDGLVVDIDNGTIAEYNGNATSVYVPEYMPVDNGDGTTTVVKITGFDTNAFRGNTNIKTVKFGKYVTEIPDNAFEGCTKLEMIEAPSIKQIGTKAFSGCVSLSDYSITEDITMLGQYAFEGVNKLISKAINEDVAENTINSGAKQIVLTNATGHSIFENKTVNIPSTTNYFEFNGASKTYNNTGFVSDAKTTVINSTTIVCTNKVPLIVSSDDLILNRSIISATRYTLVLSAESTNISLYGNVNLNTSGEDSVLCKSIVLGQLNPQAIGKLNVQGNLLICGQISNSNLLTMTDGEIIYINENEYDEKSIIGDFNDEIVETQTGQYVYYRYYNTTNPSLTYRSSPYASETYPNYEEIYLDEELSESGWSNTGMNVPYYYYNVDGHNIVFYYKTFIPAN